MTTVKDIMTGDVVSFNIDDEIIAAAKILLEKKINGAPVLDKNGKVVGVLCQSDLVAKQKTFSLPSIFTLLDGFITFTDTADMDREIKKISAAKVEDAMTPNPLTVTPETTMEKVATMMVNKKIYTIPVLESGKLVGVVGKEDIMKTIVENG